VEFEDLERDVDHVVQAMTSEMGGFRPRANFQIQVLSSLFYRNKGAYLVGKIINGFVESPLALPILHGPDGRLVIDAALFGEDALLMIFSYARAYFMVDMEIPSAYVHFLRSLMPRKPRPSSTTAWACRSTARTSSTATSWRTSVTAATSSASRRASRAW
jgi:isocitrate dehydrogenase kinase/phosphatase